MVRSRIALIGILIGCITVRDGEAQAPGGTTGVGSAVSTLTLTREVRMGSDDGGASELRGFVRMVPAANGDVYAYSGCEIKRYDRSAKFIEQIGRCGDGPNEYRSIAAIGFLGDTLWIADRNHRRVTLLPASRRNPVIIRLSYAPTHAALHAGVPSTMLRGGMAVAHPEVAWSSSNAAHERMVTSPLVRMRRDGGVVDTIANLLVRHAPDMTLSYRGAWLGAYRQPLNLRSSWAARADGEGLITVEVPSRINGRDATLRVRRFDARGMQSQSINLPFTPITVSSRMRDSLVADLTAIAIPKRDPVLAKAMEADVKSQVRAKLELPSHVPPVSQVLHGNDGSIWISGPTHGPYDSTWSVYDAAGRLVGRMQHPGKRFIAYADLTHVYAVETDDDGIPWIVRFRVTR